MKKILFILSLLIIASCKETKQVVSSEKNNEPFTMVFASCSDQDREQPLWQPIINTQPDLFIWGGDNVYSDTDDMKKMASDYEKQKTNPGYQELAKNTDIIGTWDDHDYGLNDGGSEYTLKKEAQKLFLDFWKIDIQDERHKREGIYFSENRQIKDKKILLIGLDTRYFRSPLEGEKRNYQSTSDISKTILGKEQWEWLERTFQEEADIIILASSIQILATNHGFEKWSNFPHEKERLLSLIRQFQKPVVLVSGDRHKAGIYKQENLYELTSSSLNKPLPRWLVAVWDETDPLLLGKMHYDMNYGLINIDSGSISIDLKDEKGNVLESVEFDI